MHCCSKNMNIVLICLTFLFLLWDAMERSVAWAVMCCVVNRWDCVANGVLCSTINQIPFATALHCYGALQSVPRICWCTYTPAASKLSKCLYLTCSPQGDNGTGILHLTMLEGCKDADLGYGILEQAKVVMDKENFSWCHSCGGCNALDCCCHSWCNVGSHKDFTWHWNIWGAYIKAHQQTLGTWQALLVAI